MVCLDKEKESKFVEILTGFLQGAAFMTVLLLVVKKKDFETLNFLKTFFAIFVTFFLAGSTIPKITIGACYLLLLIATTGSVAFLLLLVGCGLIVIQLVAEDFKKEKTTPKQPSQK